jgi:hypothetical protein
MGSLLHLRYPQGTLCLALVSLPLAEGLEAFAQTLSFRFPPTVNTCFAFLNKGRRAIRAGVLALRNNIPLAFLRNPPLLKFGLEKQLQSSNLSHQFLLGK